MVMTDAVADAMSIIKNAEKVGKSECLLKKASKLLGNVLKVMQKEGYIGQFEFIDDGKSGQYKLKLVGKINNCGAIKPRLALSYKELEKYEKRYLPAQGMGFLIISTPEGIFTQKECADKKIGGRLLGYVY